MSLLSDSVLVESKSARDNQLELLSHDRAQEILGKVKALYFALWRGIGMTTTEQIAEFYAVTREVVYQVVKRHRDEFDADGLKTVKGKALKDASDILSVPSTTSQVTLWTPRASLRLGMLLRDSEVAKTVRTTLLDAVQQVMPSQAQELDRLKLALALAQTQERLLQTTQAIATLHGAEMVAMILGKPDAVLTRTERVETLIPVDTQGRALAQFDDVGITCQAKRYGFGKKTQACSSCVESRGVSADQRLEESAFVKNQKISDLDLRLDRQYLTRQRNRQQLIGE